MFFSDDVVMNAAVFAVAGVLVILQIVCAVTGGDKIGKVLSFVNPLLHIGTVFFLLYAGVELDKAVLVFMVSLLSLIVSEGIIYKVKHGREDKEA